MKRHELILLILTVTSVVCLIAGAILLAHPVGEKLYPVKFSAIGSREVTIDGIRWKAASLDLIHVSGKNVWLYERFLFLRLDCSAIPTGATLNQISIHVWEDYGTGWQQPQCLNKSGAFKGTGSYDGVWGKSVLASLTPAGSKVADFEQYGIYQWKYFNTSASAWQSQFNTNKTIYLAFSGWSLTSNDVSRAYNGSTMSITISYTYIPAPLLLFGFVTADGAQSGPVEGAVVNVTNERTEDMLSDETDEDGFYQVQLADFEEGYETGDWLNITVTYSTVSNWTRYQITGGEPGYISIDLVLWFEESQPPPPPPPYKFPGQGMASFILAHLVGVIGFGALMGCILIWPLAIVWARQHGPGIYVKALFYWLICLGLFWACTRWG